MITSLVSRVSHVFGVCAVFGVLCGAAGCGAGMLSYAEDARKKGAKEFAAGEYEAATGSFRSATKQDPRDYKSYYYLGASYDAGGSYQQAIQAYQSSLKVMDLTLEGRGDKPFRAQVIEGMAIAVAKGRDRAADLDIPAPGKRLAEDAWLKAKVNRYVGDADAAVESYTLAALQDPDDFYIARDFGLYLEELGQARLADPQLRRAYRMNPNDELVNGALRRLGVVPGPGLKEEGELAKPIVPQGPIPPLKLPNFRGSSSEAAAPVTEPEGSSAQAPRD